MKVKEVYGLTVSHFFYQI